MKKSAHKQSINDLPPLAFDSPLEPVLLADPSFVPQQPDKRSADGHFPRHTQRNKKRAREEYRDAQRFASDRFPPVSIDQKIRGSLPGPIHIDAVTVIHQEDGATAVHLSGHVVEAPTWQVQVRPAERTSTAQKGRPAGTQKRAFRIAERLAVAGRERALRGLSGDNIESFFSALGQYPALIADPEVYARSVASWLQQRDFSTPEGKQARKYLQRIGRIFTGRGGQPEQPGSMKRESGVARQKQYREKDRAAEKNLRQELQNARVQINLKKGLSSKQREAAVQGACGRILAQALNRADPHVKKAARKLKTEHGH